MTKIIQWCRTSGGTVKHAVPEGLLHILDHYAVCGRHVVSPSDWRTTKTDQLPACKGCLSRLGKGPV